MKNIPETMHGVLLIGHGGLEKLEYKNNISVPVAKEDEVLIKVAAAGVNNTDINTRTGWYSKSKNNNGSSWSGAPLKFPLIQGIDVCGTIVSIGSKINSSRIGERVIARPMQTDLKNPSKPNMITLGSEIDGGFAQYVTIRSSETFVINCKWTDVELGSIPCSYSTAEGLLHRVNLGSEKIFINGASGGVGSAAIQLAKRRGAHITAQCSSSKFNEIKKIGANEVVSRETDLVKEIGKNKYDVVIDLVAGDNWMQLCEILKPGGRYATAGAIAGPMVTLDIRTLYLKDLTLYGCTHQPVEVFSNLIKYIEKDEIKPLVAKTYPLKEIKKAQEDFLLKKHVGKLVLIP
jgi:NADPH:quinone reductase-like Zn-dependent oxidoreductase